MKRWAAIWSAGLFLAGCNLSATVADIPDAGACGTATSNCSVSSDCCSNFGCVLGRCEFQQVGGTSGGSTGTRGTTSSAGSSAGSSGTGSSTGASPSSSQAGTTTGASLGGSTTSGPGTSGSGSAGTTTGGSTGAATQASTGGSSGGSTGGCQPLGAFIQIDGVAGVDSSCCGGTSSPCATLTQAMANLVAQGNLGATLQVANGGGADWAAKETWPIRLGMGVTLTLPSNLHLAGVGADTIIVEPYGSRDQSSVVTISGGVYGINSNGVSLAPLSTYNSASVHIADHGSLAIANAQVVGGLYSFKVEPGGTLTLGPGPVAVGGELTSSSSGYGIYCGGTGVAAMVTDGLAGTPVLSVVNQQDADIFALGGCTVLLVNSPTLGFVTGIGSANACTNPDEDAIGVSAEGNANVQLTGGSIDCMSDLGVSMSADSSGAPTVSLQSVKIEHVSDWAVSVFGGTFTAALTTIAYNRSGVIGWWGTPTVNLYGGGNYIGCNDQNEAEASGDGYGTLPGFVGANVVSVGSGTINAENVEFDQTPVLYTCDNTGSNCLLNGVDTGAPPPADAPAVQYPDAVSGATTGTISLASASVGACP